MILCYEHAIEQVLGSIICLDAYISLNAYTLNREQHLLTQRLKEGIAVQCIVETLTQFCPCRGKASDLKDQLLYWQTPPDATWPARDGQIKWLQQALTQLRDINIGLQQHGVNWHETEHIKLYLHIMGVSKPQ